MSSVGSQCFITSSKSSDNDESHSPCILKEKHEEIKSHTALKNMSKTLEKLVHINNPSQLDNIIFAPTYTINQSES